MCVYSVYNATLPCLSLHSLNTRHVSDYTAILRCFELFKLLHCEWKWQTRECCIIDGINIHRLFQRYWLSKCKYIFLDPSVFSSSLLTIYSTIRRYIIRDTDNHCNKPQIDESDVLWASQEGLSFMQLVKACVWLRKFRRNSDDMLDMRLSQVRFIFWAITSCSPLKINWRFRGTYRLHLQVWRINQATYQCGTSACHLISHWFLSWVIFRPCRCRRNIPPKRRLTSNILHGVIFDKIKFLHSDGIFGKRGGLFLWNFAVHF
jgi:hypothetical protein